MRRINLALRDEAQRAPSISPWLAGVASGSLVLLLAGLLTVHATSRGAISSAATANAQQQAAIESITARAADHPTVRAELADLRQREAVVTGLQQHRVDAATRLLELSRVLSRGGGPTLGEATIERIYRHRHPMQDMPWSPTWDPHRLWLTALDEDGDRLVIRGEGLTVADVGELLRRLQLSVYFNDVRLERTEQVTSANDPQALQRFTLVARL